MQTQDFPTGNPAYHHTRTRNPMKVSSMEYFLHRNLYPDQSLSSISTITSSTRTPHTHFEIHISLESCFLPELRPNQTTEIPTLGSVIHRSDPYSRRLRGVGESHWLQDQDMGKVRFDVICSQVGLLTTSSRVRFRRGGSATAWVESLFLRAQDGVRSSGSPSISLRGIRKKGLITDYRKSTVGVHRQWSPGMNYRIIEKQTVGSVLQYA